MGEMGTVVVVAIVDRNIGGERALYLLASMVIIARDGMMQGYWKLGNYILLGLIV